MLIHIKRFFFQKLNTVLSAVDLSFNVLIILTAQIKLRLLLPANILHLTFPCNFNRHCYLRLKKDLSNLLCFLRKRQEISSTIVRF